MKKNEVFPLPGRIEGRFGLPGKYLMKGMEEEMSIKDFYAAVGGSYDEIMRRLLSEERVVKYLGKFCNDKSFEMMTEEIDQKKWEDAFRDAHNLKGISVNLGLQNLFESSSQLCEAMRNGEPSVDIQPMYDQVKQDYETVISSVQQL